MWQLWSILAKSLNKPTWDLEDCSVWGPKISRSWMEDIRSILSLADKQCPLEKNFCTFIFDKTWAEHFEARNAIKKFFLDLTWGKKFLQCHLIANELQLLPFRTQIARTEQELISADWADSNWSSNVHPVSLFVGKPYLTFTRLQAASAKYKLETIILLHLLNVKIS